MDVLPQRRGNGVPRMLRSMPVLPQRECELWPHSMRIYRKQSEKLFRIGGVMKGAAEPRLGLD